jgi:hypothetical protein
MSVDAVTGVFLIVMPLAFNAAFALLAARFDYPDVLRRPTALRSSVVSRPAARASSCSGGASR